MALRSVLIGAGVLVLGIVLLAIGFVLEPARGSTTGLPNETAESLIALGLTLTLGAIGYLLAWANPQT